MKILYLVAFLLGTLSLSAQQWQTELPYTSGCPECDIRDFIITNDNGFLVLLNSIDEEEEEYVKLVHTMVKYDSLGSLEWEKNYDFGVSGPWASSDGGGATPTKVVQLEDSNYMMTGGFRDVDTTFAYILITNSVGDSIIFQQTIGFGNLQIVNDNNVYVNHIDSNEEYLILKLDEAGGIVDTINLGITSILSFLVGNQGDILAYRGLNPRSYKKYRNNGSLLHENFTLDRAGIIVQNEIQGITAYESDLIKMDSNLNIVWQYTHEEIYPGIPDDGHIGSDIIQTSDDGCIITGYIFDEFFSGVFMSKYDTEGVRLWGGLYPADALPITYIHQVKEVSDGLVVLGGNKFTEAIWLIKLYSDGNWATNTRDFLETEVGMTIYPNPGKGNFNIKFSEKVSGQVNILNSQGQLVKMSTVNNIDATQQILSNIPSGFYYVQFVDLKGYPTTIKYIKN